MPLPNGRLLDATKETLDGSACRSDLAHVLVGQPVAIDYYVSLVERFKAHLYNLTKPIGAVLETGPTGSGKTYAGESFAESLQPRVMRDWKKNMMRIDCGEFQHSHDVAKLVGSPPGYLGHKETKPMLSAERIGLLQQGSTEFPFAIIMFDEIEKASDGLWNILLGILDKGSLTLGTNEAIDLSKTVIIMTSNAGFSDRKDGLGFAPASYLNSAESARIGMEAAKRKFSVEFINRLDAVIPFNALSQDDISKILKLELGKLQMEVFTRCTPNIIFTVTPAGQAQLLKTGYDVKYNARNIKRTIDKELRQPLSRILGNYAVLPSEGVLIDYTDKFTFHALPKNNSNLVLHGTDGDKGDLR